MKLKKLFALALAVCMMALAVPAAFAAGLTLDYGTTPTTPVVEEPIQSYSTYADYPVMPLAEGENGLVLSKNISTLDADARTYQVELQAFSTGSAVYAPADIVLVLDESSGMSKKTTSYQPVYSLDNEKTYYIERKDDNNNISYVPVKYCPEFHVASGSGIDFNLGGWYTGDHFWIFHLGYHYQPKRNQNDTGRVQFFEAFESETDTTKLNALQTAAVSFVGEIKGFAVEKSADYRVSVISYKDDALSVPENNDARVKLGLTSVNNDTNVGIVNGAIAALNTSATEGVALPKALELANAQLSAVTESDRQKVVVVFSSMDDISKTDADAAIQASKSLKRIAQVFTVGMMDISDPTLDVADDQIQWDKIETLENKSIILVNTRLQGISSNYLNATACQDLDSKSQVGDYYKKATNKAQITSILTAIQTQLTETETKLTADAEIRDYITQYFTIDSAVTVETFNCLSYSKDAQTGKITATWDSTAKTSRTSEDYIDGNTVAVSGFDFSKYFVTAEAKANNTEAPHGRKVVVTFTIKAKDAFLGGDNVPANGDNAGIYANSTATTASALFVNPKVKVNVPDITVKAENKNVYLLGSIDATHMLTNAIATAGGASLDLDATNYGLEEWQYEYVDIVVSSGIVDELNFKGTNDGKYTVSCTITSRANSENTKTGSATCDINVFKPTLEYPDYTIYLGGKNPEFAYDATKTAWMHGTTNAVNVEDMIGTAPVVTVTAFDKDVFKNCEDVNLAAANAANIGGTDVTAHVQVKPFKVHVKTPVIKCDGKTIFYGDEATLVADIQEAWTSCGCNDAPANMSNAKPTEKAFTYSGGANVKPSECTTYTVTLDSIGTASVSDLNFVGKTTTATVHVLIPEITMNEEDIIYYGDTADLEHKLNWVCTKGCQVDIPNGAPVDKDDCTFSCGSLRLTGCDTNVTVSVEVDGKTFNGKNNAAIHVLKPEITAANKTLYWTQPYGLNSSMTVAPEWKCDGHGLTGSVKTGTAPTNPIDFTFTNNANNDVETNETDLVLDDCTTYAVTATINGLEFPLDDNSKSVTVHVVKPVISCADTAIYLGNSVDLNAQMTEDPAWKCTTATCPGHVTLAVKDNKDNRVAPALDHVFSTDENEAAYEPSTCTPVRVTSTIKTGSVSKDVTPTQNTFTVHVYVPQFTVTTQDLWADFGSEVPLYDTTKAVDAIVDIAYPANEWVDRKADYNTAPKAGAQEIADIAIQFSSPNPIDSMGESDVDVNVIKLSSTVNGTAYVVTPGMDVKTDANLTVIKAVPDEDHDFTVHVNKFKAVITNNGTQNAIYTLSNGTKVAVEAGKSTTVAGLICGKDYEISEANNDWTWRYGEAASAKDGDGDEKAYISCKVNEVKASDTPESSDRVFMTYDNITNPKWLADEDCVVNNAATRDCTIPERKEDGEEVTNE